MKIVLAPDKFKGSLTGFQFCKVVEQNIKLVLPHAKIIKLPLADGGDGTIEILEYHLKGVKILEQVLDSLHPHLAIFYNNIAGTYYELGNYKKAIRDYRKVAEVNRNLKKIAYYNNIGKAYVKNKQFKEAYSAFERHEKLYPNEGRSYRNWAMYYALKGKKGEALSNLQKAIELGYKNMKWLKTDDSMDSLRKEQKFIDLIQQLEKRA